MLNQLKKEMIIIPHILCHLLTLGWIIKYNIGRIIYYKSKILEKRQTTKIGETYSDNWKPGKTRYIIKNSLFKLIFFLFNF